MAGPSPSPRPAPPPGPRGTWLGGNLAAFAADPLAFLTACTRDHGDFVALRFLRTRTVLINDHDAIEQVLFTQSRRFPKAAPGSRSFVQRVFGHGLLTSEGDFWVRQRRLMQPAFHRPRTAVYAPVIVDFAREMMASWQPGEVRDLHADLTTLAARVLLRALFGTPVPPAIDTFQQLSRESMEQMRRLQNPLAALRALLPGGFHARFHAMMDAVDHFIATQIAAHRAGHGDPADILTMMLAARDDQGQGMSDVQLRDELMTLIAAGLDTTVLAMSWSCELLARHPDAAGRLQAELESVLGGRPPGLADLERLPYTQAVLREAMRLYPPAWMMTRTAAEDTVLGGFLVPRGTQVMISQWLKHRDARLFPEPEVFRPERWLAAPSLPRFGYFPFGGGGRVCIGSGLALMEAPLGLAALWQHFSLEPVSATPTRPWASLTLQPEGGLPLRLRRRNPGR